MTHPDMVNINYNKIIDAVNLLKEMRNIVWINVSIRNTLEQLNLDENLDNIIDNICNLIEILEEIGE